MTKINVTRAATGYALPVGADSALNPVDATTYFFGSFVTVGAGATGGERRVYVPRKGRITAAYLYFLNTGTLASAETSNIVIRVNDTTDYPAFVAVSPGRARSSNIAVTGLNIPVAAGDSFELKWVTPTWATNPTSLRWTGSVNIEP